MVEQVGPVYLNGLNDQGGEREVAGRFRPDLPRGSFGRQPASEVRALRWAAFRTIQVNVMGEVEMPGTYRLSSFATVFHALYQAGGVTDIGTPAQYPGASQRA